MWPCLATPGTYFCAPPSYGTRYIPLPALTIVALLIVFGQDQSGDPISREQIAAQITSGINTHLGEDANAGFTRLNLVTQFLWGLPGNQQVAWHACAGQTSLTKLERGSPIKTIGSSNLFNAFDTDKKSATNSHAGKPPNGPLSQVLRISDFNAATSFIVLIQVPTPSIT